MNDQEMRQWLAVTQESQFRWTEDEITKLNGKGALYYYGGENGVYMRLRPNGELEIGTYEDAFPHIGEAWFQQKSVKDYGSFESALQAAMKLGGIQFLRDMFSGNRPNQPLFQTDAEKDIGMQMM